MQWDFPWNLIICPSLKADRIAISVVFHVSLTEKRGGGFSVRKYTKQMRFKPVETSQALLTNRAIHGYLSV